MEITAEIKQAAKKIARLGDAYHKAEEDFLKLISPLSNDVEELIALLPHVPDGWVYLKVFEKIGQISGR